MKLVQLLAKELKEWPEGVDVYAQDANGQIYPWVGIPHLDEEEWLGEVGATIHQGNSWFGGEGMTLCEDHMTANVTKSQWQAEREKMNKPKWIRHRGGKCPVAGDVKVLYRMRSGTITSRGEPSRILSWDHSKSGADIMAYRVIEETKDQEIEEVKKTNFGTITYKLEIDATDANKEIDSLVAKWGQIVSPLKWRDAIIHCQAIIEDCEREIEKNVNLLDAEGLMMQKDSKKAMQHYAPDVDMSDWRNWKSGDIVECITSAYTGVYTMGQQYIVEWVDEDGFSVFDNYGGESSCDWFEHESEGLKFIRRP